MAPMGRLLFGLPSHFAEEYHKRLFSACNLNPPGNAEASLEDPEGIFEASASGYGASPGDTWASFKILEASPGVRDALASGSVASPGNTGVSFEVPETSPVGQNSTSGPKDARAMQDK
ncbi:hypothetical protein MVEG_08286 [Podila verticillata NRRL 6337]|nr:hypothetical protein MVEG_08286 [Podila verticillata NRRL 6337]